jgi:hypothetical protein
MKDCEFTTRGAGAKRPVSELPRVGPNRVYGVHDPVGFTKLRLFDPLRLCAIRAALHALLLWNDGNERPPLWFCTLISAVERVLSSDVSAPHVCTISATRDRGMCARCWLLDCGAVRLGVPLAVQDLIRCGLIASLAELLPEDAVCAGLYRRKRLICFRIFASHSFLLRSVVTNWCSSH